MGPNSRTPANHARGGGEEQEAEFERACRYGAGETGPVGKTETLRWARERHSYFTTPSMRAKSVKSLPSPTLRPG